MKGKKIISYAILILGYFIGIYSIYCHREFNKDKTLFLKNNWSLSYENKEIFKNKSIPLYYNGEGKKSFEKGIYSYSTQFFYDKSFKTPILVFPYVLNQAYELYLNGFLIGKKGDMIQGRSNLWHTPITESIPKGILQEKNTLIIKTFSSYESGITIKPYIKDTNDNIFQNFIVNIFFIDFPLIQSTITFTLSIAFIIMTFKAKENKIFDIYYTLSLIFFFFYSLDFHTIEILPVKYIYFKKFTVSSLYIFLLFSTLALNKLDKFGKKKYCLSLVYSLICVVFLLIFSPNNESILRSYYSKCVVLVIFYLLYNFYVIYKNKNNKYLTKLFWAILTIFIVTIHDAISLNFGNLSIILFSNSLFIYSYYATSMFLAEVINYHKQLNIEKTKANTYYEMSRIDPLTEAYNRKRLEELEKEIEGEYTVVYFDMDKFKEINDNYGHFVGDKALIALVTLIKSKLGNQIDLIRIGGDEFVLVLQESKEVRESFLKDMLKASRGSKFQYKNREYTFRFSLGISSSKNRKDLYKIISNADKLLYDQKKSSVQA